MDNFGPVYTQFAGKPKEAIKFLRKMKDGECIAALHRDDIGNIDIVWGKVNNKKTEVKPRSYTFVTVKNIDADSLCYLRCMVKRHCKITINF